VQRWLNANRLVQSERVCQEGVASLMQIVSLDRMPSNMLLRTVRPTGDARTHTHTQIHIHTCVTHADQELETYPCFHDGSHTHTQIHIHTPASPMQTGSLRLTLVFCDGSQYIYAHIRRHSRSADELLNICQLKNYLTSQYKHHSYTHTHIQAQ
jgi:hypothetical protein